MCFQSVFLPKSVRHCKGRELRRPVLELSMDRKMLSRGHKEGENCMDPNSVISSSEIDFFYKANIMMANLLGPIYSKYDMSLHRVESWCSSNR